MHIYIYIYIHIQINKNVYIYIYINIMYKYMYRIKSLLPTCTATLQSPKEHGVCTGEWCKEAAWLACGERLRELSPVGGPGTA